MGAAYFLRCAFAFSLFAATALGWIQEASGQTISRPILSTEVPTASTVGSSFFVFLPLVNTGIEIATSVNITSATLGGSSLTHPPLPLAVGTLAPGKPTWLQFQFNDAKLTSGQRYLLTVRGTYLSGTVTLGFTVSRILTFGIPSIYDLPANPLNVTPALDTGNAVTQVISVANGGTLTTKGADGSVFMLTIPPKALLSNEAITMTPIASIPDIPLSGGFVAGVDLQPQGLRLYAPATLTIQSARNGPTSQLWGFSYDNAGKDFYLYPRAVQSAVSMQILHFTGFGYGMAPSLGATMEAALALKAEARLQQQVAKLFQNAQTMDPQFQSELAGLTQQFYTDVVVPLLDAAFGDDTFWELAVATATSWGKVVTILGLDQQAPFSTEVPSVLQTVIQLTIKYYNNAFQRCIAPDGVRPVEGGKMLRARAVLEFFNVDINAALPNFKGQLAACLVGPLELTFDSTIKDSTALALDTTSHVLASSVPLILNATNPANIYYYNERAPLEYVSFDGTIHWKPPASDCGSKFVGQNGTMVAAAVFDLNTFAYTNPLAVKLQVAIGPTISETITGASISPMSPCTVDPPQTTEQYLVGFAVIKGANESTGGPAFLYEVDLDVPTTFNLRGSFAPLTASETTTITLAQQKP